MRHLWADPHLDHENVIEMCARPFSTISEMNQELIYQCNSYVDRRDTLIVVGDFAWANFSKWRAEIRCRDVWLIWGNHDKKSIGRLFSWSGDTRYLKLGKDRQHCFISHYCHCYWPGSHRGSIHVYGHHHNQREQYLNAIWPDRRAMDVGVDVAYAKFGVFRPFTEDEVCEELMSRKGHDEIDFYKTFQKELHALRSKDPKHKILHKERRTRSLEENEARG